MKWDRTKKEKDEWIGKDNNSLENMVQMSKHKTISTYHKISRNLEMKRRLNK